jgi:hypothetical protein
MGLRPLSANLTPSVVSDADWRLFEVRCPLHFRAGQAAEKLGAGKKRRTSRAKEGV